MELVWYVILGFMLIMYIILDGFDFGAGIIHLFFAKTPEEKKDDLVEPSKTKQIENIRYY